MNKEDLIFELKKRCSFWLNNKTISKKHALECLLGILENEETQPSLPSDIDEAAKECAIREGYLAGLHHEIMKRVFKAGAEWMAGQGVSMLGRIGIYGVDVESITKELREAGFNLGEEIILQIRKKQ